MDIGRLAIIVFLITPLFVVAVVIVIFIIVQLEIDIGKSIGRHGHALLDLEQLFPFLAAKESILDQHNQTNQHDEQAQGDAAQHDGGTVLGTQSRRLFDEDELRPVTTGRRCLHEQFILTDHTGHQIDADHFVLQGGGQLARVQDERQIEIGHLMVRVEGIECTPVQ